jgi:hypothetical protein
MTAPLKAGAHARFQLRGGLVGRGRWHRGEAGEARRILLHGAGEVIVGVAGKRNGLRRLQLLDAWRGERHHLHVRQALRTDIAQPFDEIGVAAADRFGAVLQLAAGAIKKSRRGEVLFERYGFHEFTLVIRGLDPRIHAELPLGEALSINACTKFSMDCRVKPGNDERGATA